jgi:uncharacterized protein (TIGR02597 family)
MNKLPLKTPLLIGAFLTLTVSLFGSTVTTTPVGYITKTADASSDLKLGLPFKQAASLTAVVSSVSSSTITVTGVVPDVTSEAHYVWVTSGDSVGNWYQVTSSDSSTVTVSDNIEASLSAGDSFEVIPFWTLNKLFPSGAGFISSPNVFTPSGFILTNNMSAVGVNLAPESAYFYHDGGQIPAGWYQNGALGAGQKGNVVISPESFITIRNLSASSVDITVAGTVPAATVSNDIVQLAAARQDNLVANPFPTGVKLSESCLVYDNPEAGVDAVLTGTMDPSSNVFTPGDLLLVYNSYTGTNPAPDKAFLYHDGSQIPAGWYQNGALGSGQQGDFTIPAGAAVVIRKSAGVDSLVSWSPDLPYSLVDTTP